MENPSRYWIKVKNSRHSQLEEREELFGRYRIRSERDGLRFGAAREVSELPSCRSRKDTRRTQLNVYLSKKKRGLEMMRPSPGKQSVWK